MYLLMSNTVIDKANTAVAVNETSFEHFVPSSALKGIDRIAWPNCNPVRMIELKHFVAPAAGIDYGLPRNHYPS